MNHPPGILIIDDSSYIRMSASRMLKDLGYRDVDTADDGKSGLDKFRTSHPHLVILDGVLPELDGLAVLRLIKKERPETKVIITSSLSARERIVEFKEAGANFYLLKPYSREKFNEVITHAIAIKEGQ